jgi:hypothetical protein
MITTRFTTPAWLATALTRASAADKPESHAQSPQLRQRRPDHFDQLSLNEICNASQPGVMRVAMPDPRMWPEARQTTAIMFNLCACGAATLSELTRILHPFLHPSELVQADRA